jgi:hypothetical protein
MSRLHHAHARRERRAPDLEVHGIRLDEERLFDVDLEVACLEMSVEAVLASGVGAPRTGRARCRR